MRLLLNILQRSLYSKVKDEWYLIWIICFKQHSCSFLLCLTTYVFWSLYKVQIEFFYFLSLWLKSFSWSLMHPQITKAILFYWKGILWYVFRFIVLKFSGFLFVYPSVLLMTIVVWIFHSLIWSLYILKLLWVEKRWI